ncbi:LysR substrate-binding domain-containing protein [Marinomonas sp. C2222]|uniref:LysR substrate-binding domain-containing protein n=1 Tax=Marinomonas sargassi TaxID=2984494 RepID=A0ABT2YQS9_9GAMM|nr:LysR substrate-binding domain-containing protein [Marinomonas sargassi]MCV2402252.1 LysR substrate-binding domain-containing protein [Marinomonas sargassi]
MSKIHNKRQLPPLGALTAFEAAAKHQSFSRAAEEVNLTHGAISRAVAQLEERIGVELFVRRNRRVYLTMAGRRLLKTVSESLNALSDTVEEIHRHDKNSPFLTVSCEPSLAMRWLMPRLGSFKEQHPELNIDLRMAGGPIDLLSENCDLAIRRNDFGIPDNYSQTFLCSEMAGPVCTDNYWQEQANQALDQAHWLHSRTRPNAWEDWRKQQELMALKPQSEQYFDHFFYALQAAQAGLGIAIGSTPLVSDDLVLNQLAPQTLISPMGMQLTGYDYVLLSLTEPTQDQRIDAFTRWLIVQFEQSNC